MEINNRITHVKINAPCKKDQSKEKSYPQTLLFG